jgi:acetyltransferase-like isoleucine patch superfamily enzyme
MKILKRTEPKINNPKSRNFLVFAEDNVKINNTEIFGTIFFGFSSYINSGIIRSYCEIGRYCSIGRNVSIGLGNHDINGLSTSPFFEHLIPQGSLKLASETPIRRVIIGNDVWIGDNVMISSGVTIGDGAVLAGGAVITKDVEPYTIVGGIPAKLIRSRFPPETIEQLKIIKWWEIKPENLLKLNLINIHHTIQELSKFEESKERAPINYHRISV